MGSKAIYNHKLPKLDLSTDREYVDEPISAKTI